MKKFGDVPKNRGKSFLAVTGSLSFALVCAFGLPGAIQIQIQPQAQNTTAVTPVYEFEAASIKPNKSGVTSFTPGFTADGYRAVDASLQWLVREAYGVKDYSLLAVPDWLNTERYDVEAKMDASVADALKKLTPDQLKSAQQEMLQTFLAERLNLKIHRETKQETVYFLAIGKNGSKLQESKTADTRGFPGPDGGLSRARMEIGLGAEGGHKASGYSVPIRVLAEWLSVEVTRPVLDKTGLTGAYDFTLEWMPEMVQTPAADAASTDAIPGIPAASIFTAVQQQLGLKLESGKGPIGVVVIDHVQRPSGN